MNSGSTGDEGKETERIIIRYAKAAIMTVLVTGSLLALVTWFIVVGAWFDGSFLFYVGSYVRSDSTQVKVNHSANRSVFSCPG